MEDFVERDKNEDGVEGGEDKGVDKRVHVEESSVRWNELDDYCGEDDYWHHPFCEIPPRTEDFLAHPVGDEGEEENGENRKQ